ncbi:MAG TPA: hypothetical protein VFO38_02495, partial [Candidatus Saccharimonadales bacterium]|nr:hypothetical protein [Candidatus Saccharimonadales bacterium]
MQQLYYEIRNLPSQQQPIAADIAHHLQMRQYLGKSIVLCDSPSALLSAVRKQWLKSARTLQRQRASTLNPEEILRLTHSIMHMQNMQFSVQQPSDAPDASVYFLEPGSTAYTPIHCFTVYVTTEISPHTYQQLIAAAPKSTLFTIFSPLSLPADVSVAPKSVLETQMLECWQSIRNLFSSVGLNPDNLVIGGKLQFAAMDTAL